MKSFLKQNIDILSLILIGSLTWVLTMVKSGWIRDYGAGFWGPNGHDGIWHIALIESLARGSWEIPVFAGEPLRNYHVGFDLLVAWLHKLAFIPVPILFFQVLPIVLAVLIGFFVFRFVLLMVNSRTSALWSTFFVYFGGSFGWILSIFRNGNLDGESVFWSQQAISSLVNPPFALSLVIIFAGLGLLIEGVGQKSKNKLFLATMLFGILVQIKVYAGILSLGGLFVAGAWEVLRNRNFTFFKVFVGALIISILVFSPLNGGSSSQVVWQPFWFLENMMALSDRVGWPRFYSAMNTYRIGDIYFKAIAAYSVAFSIFVLGNFGTRILSFFWIIGKIKTNKISSMEVILVSIISGGVLIPMFLVQSGSPWNTIQFVYYSLTFSAVLSGIFFSQFLKHKPAVLKYIFATTLILITVPTSYATLFHHYLPGRPPAKISSEELTALKFLSQKPLGVVLTYPFDADKAKAAQAFPPRPLYLYDSTAYVSAYAKKTLYLEDEVNLDITGYDWRERRVQAEKFYKSLDQTFVRSFLKSNNIKYIYWLKGQRADLGESQLGIQLIFENSSASIYEVK